jgi:hypothetical protein
MRIPEEVVQVAIDDALRAASPFYESMARDHIPALQVAIFQALEAEGYQIAPIPPPTPSVCWYHWPINVEEHK